MHDYTEDLILGVTVDADSVDRTALQTSRYQASAKALYEAATAQWEEVCEILEITLPETDDGESDTTGMESPYT